MHIHAHNSNKYTSSSHTGSGIVHTKEKRKKNNLDTSICLLKYTRASIMCCALCREHILHYTPPLYRSIRGPAQNTHRTPSPHPKRSHQRQHVRINKQTCRTGIIAVPIITTCYIYNNIPRRRQRWRFVGKPTDETAAHDGRGIVATASMVAVSACTYLDKIKTRERKKRGDLVCELQHKTAHLDSYPRVFRKSANRMQKEI